MTYSLIYKDDGSTTYAVDWAWLEKGWTCSEKENSSSIKWFNRGILDNWAYKALVNIFGIPKDKYSLEQISTMSPAQLAEIGGKNPRSGTLGDHRFALEVC